MRDGGSTNLAINSVMCLNDCCVLRSAAPGEQGFTKLPTFLVGPDFKADRLKIVLPKFPLSELGIFAL
jgi:hypothetical protein